MRAISAPRSVAPKGRPSDRASRSRPKARARPHHGGSTPNFLAILYLKDSVEITADETFDILHLGLGCFFGGGVLILAGGTQDPMQAQTFQKCPFCN